MTRRRAWRSGGAFGSYVFTAQGFPKGLDVQEDVSTEYCFKLIARTVNQSDDDDDDDDDDEDSSRRQITRRCCEGWYTPAGKPLCSAKRREYSESKTATSCPRCENLSNELVELEKLIKSAQSTRGSPRPFSLRYLIYKIASLEKKNKEQEEKIMYLEEQMMNLTSSLQGAKVVERFRSTVERAAASSAADPCDEATCPDHPQAMCMVTSKCGRDVAVFIDEEFNQVNCNSKEPCDMLPPTFCPDDPCLGKQCDGYPDAMCIVTECDCVASFVLPDGSTPSCNNSTQPHIPSLQ